MILDAVSRKQSCNQTQNSLTSIKVRLIGIKSAVASLPPSQVQSSYAKAIHQGFSSGDIAVIDRSPDTVVARCSSGYRLGSCTSECAATLPGTAYCGSARNSRRKTRLRPCIREEAEVKDQDSKAGAVREPACQDLSKQNNQALNDGACTRQSTAWPIIPTSFNKWDRHQFYRATERGRRSTRLSVCINFSRATRKR